MYVLTYAELSKKGKIFVSSLVAILVPLTIRKSCCRCAFDIKTFEQCFSPKKLSKFAWFCSGFVPHNQEHPTSDHQDDKLKPKSVILTPFPGALLALWKCPLLVLPPYKPPQKAKKIIVFCDAVSSKEVFFSILCSEPLFLCFWPFLPLYFHNFQFLHFLRVQVLHQGRLEGKTPNCQSTLPIDKLQTVQFSAINVTQV